MISFEQARAIAASSPEVRQWFIPRGVEIADWGHENSRDLILVGRSPGEPWHELPDPANSRAADGRGVQSQWRCPYVYRRDGARLLP